MKLFISCIVAGLSLLSTTLAQDTYLLEVRLLRLSSENPTPAELMKAVDQPEALLATVKPLQLAPGQTAQADETTPHTLPQLVAEVEARTVPIGTKVTATLKSVTDIHARVSFNLEHVTLVHPTAPITSNRKVNSDINLPIGTWVFPASSLTNRSTQNPGPETRGTENIVQALRVTRL